MKKCFLAAVIALCALVGCVQAVEKPDELAKGFQNPPPEARPWVYWFWLNGNITREGITADLEAMKRASIGGVLIMEVDQGIPRGPVDFMSAQWRDLFKHVASEAQRLGLEVNMNDDAGWNGSGGPWIKPEESMQKIVWSEAAMEGPAKFDATLPQPETVAGYYRDIAVLAFPTPGDYRIEGIKGKAVYERQWNPQASDKQLPPEMTIERSRIVDLTEKMGKDGKLAWDAPAGKWTVMRFGHTSTGAENAPAPETGRGLECDKLSKKGIEAQFAGMMGPLIGDVGDAAGKTLVATHIDSWENGAQNWTLLMREEFQKRRGYDPLPFLPVVTARVVDNLEISERFLWDLRQTVSDLVVENYADHMRRLANEKGLRLSIEAYGGPCDDMTYGGRADEPMGEFWMGGSALETCKGMASAAHVYGKRIVGAEAFTAGDHERWLDHPGSIKTLGDRAFCAGINRFVFHRYAMQPWLNYKPGMTMGPWGLHYERTQTWWEESSAWHEYLARCQHLLRMGLYVADICCLQQEESPQGFIPHSFLGYEYDNCTAEVVLTRMSVRDGRIVLPDGMSYRVLVLPEIHAMTLPLLLKIRELVEAGATVVGPRPVKSPSLSDFPECDAEVKRIADEVWGDCDGRKATEHAFGKGRVVWGMSPERVLSLSGARPDFIAGSRLIYIHRSTDDAEIYFVANPQQRDVATACNFRVTGKRPELWDPESGDIEPAAVHEEKDGGTNVMLSLSAGDSVFVVFRYGEARDHVIEASRNGEPLASAVRIGPKITVLKAVYGVPEDPARTRDVKDRIQTMVDQGEYSFPVSRMAMGDDPAQGVQKILMVEYTIGDRKRLVKGRDSDTITLSDIPGRIAVQKAVYGVLDDPKRTRDVKDRVQRIVDAGEQGFQVARMAEGDDPAFMVVKTLIVDYTIDGKPYKSTGIDPQTIYLEPPAAPSERKAEIRCNSDGNIILEAWKPGRYELTMSSGAKREISIDSLPEPLNIEGAWDVRFAPGLGAPERATFDKLISWSEHADPGVKHFSGAATYEKTVNVPESMIGKNRRLSLDLGKVQVMARVKVNGKDASLLWRMPFRADITEAIKPGANAFEITVINLWPNRMIGDELLPEDSDRHPQGTLNSWPKWVLEGKPSPSGRFTFTTWQLWKKDQPLLESGLIGPVTLQTSDQKTIQ
ncbi:MAG TPA: glycosyl hydrolase [Candidatus Brocadiia bacterium]|nr:glycosyl hydrolase [Candidatus Brocadiia bacterium]